MCPYCLYQSRKILIKSQRAFILVLILYTLYLFKHRRFLIQLNNVCISLHLIQHFKYEITQNTNSKACALLSFLHLE